MITFYGLKNCDTCRKALKWLETENIPHHVKDVRADGVPTDFLAGWVDHLGWESLLNRRSTTWRNLDEADKSEIDANKAIQLMGVHPTLIKRPVFVTEQQDVLVGFTDKTKQQILGS